MQLLFNTITEKILRLFLIFECLLNACTATYSQTAIDLSRPVGATEGAAGTNGIGAATYAIPIKIPVGIKGVQPTVGISYSSQGAGDGYCGYGWSAASVSMISRAGKSYYHDSTSTPVNYTGSNDAFVLDGRRLMVISGTNGADGAVYGTEQESFSKIESFGGSGNSPNWFKVTTKTGTILEYGVDAAKMMTNDNSQVMFWLLRKVSDASGNYMLYNYTIDNTNRHYNLSSIEYGGNANTGTSTAYKIVFTYDAKSDWQNAPIYISGSSLYAAHILNRIDVKKTDNTQIRSYSFAYQYRQKKYFLTGVTEAGADGTMLNPITFTYGENTVATDIAVSAEYTTFKPVILSGDFDGNGVQDVQQHATTFDNNGFQRFKSFSTTNAYAPVNTGGVWTSNYNGYSYNNTNYWSTEFVGTLAAQEPILNYDFDGDGKEDVLITKTTYDIIGDPPIYYQSIDILYSRRIDASTGVTYKKISYTGPLISSYGYHQTIKTGGTYLVPGDFDGNGEGDYILILSVNDVPNQFKAFLSTPSKNVLNQEIVNFGVGVNGAIGDLAAIKVAESKQVLPVNFNGDGKTDLLVVRDEGSYVLSISGNATTGYTSGILTSTPDIITNSKVYPGDFNGDGYTDLLVRQANVTTWKVFLSTGAGFNQVPFLPQRNIVLPGDGFSTSHLFSVGDYDGDAKSDIWHVSDSATVSNHTIYYFNGASFSPENYVYNQNINSEVALAPADFNGDGKPDLVSIKYNSNYKARFIFPKPFKEQNLLTGISNLGYLTTIKYGQLNNTTGNIYTRSADNEYDVDDRIVTTPLYLRNYMVPKMPMYMVSTISHPEGITETYHYADLVLHNTGRGLLGFKKLTVTNNADIRNTAISEISLERSLLYPVRQYSTLHAGDTLSRADIFTAFQSLSTTPGNKRFFAKTERAISKNYKTNAATETLNTYDSYGNITQSIVKAGTSDGNTVSPIETATVNTTYGTYAGAAFPAFPLTVTAQKTRTGQPQVSRTGSTSYTAQGLPATVTENVGTAIETSTTNTYNGFGLLTQTTINAPGVTTPVTNYVYDATGRFLMEKQLTGGGITKREKFTYDDRWGVPLTQTATDGLTTSYLYNTFGELIRTDLPDGNAITVTKNWETGSLARFRVTTQRADGSNPSRSYMNILGREIKKETRGFNNQWITSEKLYNHLGQLFRETSPHYPGEPVKNTVYQYDSLGRPVYQSSSTGVVNITYSNAGNTYTIQTTNGAGQSSTSITDASGKAIQTISNGTAVDFTYDSWGNQLQSGSNGQVFVTNVYDSYGRKTSATDANAGVVTYQYNSIGQMVQQTDANNTTQSITYDVFGRTLTSTGPQGTTTYTYYYHPVTGKSNNNITQIVGFSGDVHQYQYDALQRVTNETITAAGNSLSKSFEYDTRGNLVKTNYPAGFAIRDVYDDNGILIQTKYEQGATIKTLFTATAINSRGIYTGYNTGNGKTKAVTWDFVTEKPIRFYTAGVQDVNLAYENFTQNLLSRNDGIRSLTETFTYDNDDRLTGSQVNGVQQFAMTYDAGAQGKILQKTDIGNYQYDPQKTHALEYLAPINGGVDPNTTIGPNTQTITYTAFRKVETISENGYQLTYSYGYDRERLTSELKQGSTTIETRNHWGIMEGVTKNGVSSEIYYINAGNGLNNIIVKQNGNINIYYTYTDQLGSITAVTDEAGNIIAEQNFDAWGRKRNPANWTYNSIPAIPDWLYRGFTGHEYLPSSFGGAGGGPLINMNGRMYDPMTGQMMAPDNFVQYPGMPAGYNRYQYANGNPLKFTDPSGWLSAAEWSFALNLIYETFVLREGYGGYVISGGSSGRFGSNDEAFGYGARQMGENGWWGANPGWATSYYSAARAYYGSGYTGRPSPGEVTGYYKYEWRHMPRYDIRANYSGGLRTGYGYSVGWTSGGTADVPTVGSMLVSFYKMTTLINSFYNYHYGPSTSSNEMQIAFSGAIALSNMGGVSPHLRAVMTGVGAALVTAAAISVVQKYMQRPGVQYTLRAKVSGMYPVFEYGSNSPVDKVHLDAGEIWKIGQTTQYNVLTGDQWRYPDVWLQNMNLDFKDEFVGSYDEIWMAEKMKIWNYISANGDLPPGNKVPW